jgi:hypothetical protein
MKNDHANEGKAHCCEHGHGESALPQTWLVAASGILTAVGLVLG